MRGRPLFRKGQGQASNLREARKVKSRVEAAPHKAFCAPL
jgi:hypothetical protein